MIAIYFFIILLLLFFLFFFLGKAPLKKVSWGVVFSSKHSRQLGLDPEENYLAILDDLKVRHLRIITHWDEIEKEKGKFDFSDLDFQIREAERRGAKLILVVGLKTGRWPECHLPNWARSLKGKELKEAVFKMTSKIVKRYKNSSALWAWHVENEPFFIFGECPPTNFEFVKEEISLVKSIDPNHPIIVSDSGEGSFWFKVSKLADIPATTMYRRVWVSSLKFYFNYQWLLPPIFYWRKAQIIKKVFNKKMICTELQAEPWGPKLLYDLPLAEQKKTMDLDQFRKNIEFAKKTGFERFYLWGVEWWYWLKVKKGNPSIWQEAKKLF